MSGRKKDRLSVNIFKGTIIRRLILILKVTSTWAMSWHKYRRKRVKKEEEKKKKKKKKTGSTSFATARAVDFISVL